MYKFLFIAILVLSVLTSRAQNRIFGKVTDAATGEVLPFVNVYIKNTNIGTTTDDKGTFNIKLSKLPDSLTVSFVGYRTLSKALKRGVSVQELNFKLFASTLNLQEVVIRPGENPAFKIMRQVIEHKKTNDKRRLRAYQFEAYTKMQFDIDNLAPKKKKIGLRTALSAVVDSQMYIQSNDGKKVLPFFISESVSDFYYNRDPRKTKEIVKASKVTGYGIQDGNLVAQVIGNSYQDYNFYQNYVSVLQKNFISPMADGWKSAYEYDLVDSVYIGKTRCYKIKIEPKRAQDLAFNGSIWIADSSFALRKIDVLVSKAANINFVEKIHLVQEALPVTGGTWLPSKTDLTMNLARISESRPGIIAKINTSCKNILVNQEQKQSFFDQPIVLADKANSSSESFWEQSRHDTLTAVEKQVYSLIDSIKSTPRIKHITKVVTVLATGYFKAGPINIGRYPYFYAHNNVEGHRFQVGGKTNIDFSNKWELKGFAAYGTLDKRFKYETSARFIISRKKWSEVGFTRKEDVERVGLMSEKLEDSYFLTGFSRFGDLRRPFYLTQTSGYLQRDIFPGLRQRISLSNRIFKPEYDFAYYRQEGEQPKVLTRDFSSTTVTFFTRYAQNEVFVQNDNERISLGSTTHWPIFTFKYTLGLNGLFGSTVDYQRIDVGVKHDFVMGRLGNAIYRLEAGKIYSPVPYPLLENHLGNETPFYYAQTFNLMNYFEFASDTYASLHYEQYFEGLLFNRLPLIKKLKWRIVGTSNVLYGQLSKENQALISPVGYNGTPQEPVGTLNKTPYVEAGYAIENIFKVLRIDAFHRVTYLQNPDVKKFGLKFSLQFKL
ncbi:DUF5686 and carboxypeptidase-like regulatory domain-containing protein [Adhaeribacter radiodurans]|uniref:Carboxypeptidase-like regulatory domain-containing protein n=1 Tax=Adhaeribacter radiodurans TaxID=2745197 RepID=A0A7L7L6D9_9BACT|nr:DUF5686 and carboxypeptidase-like regulatory domain-containing protein [Adhaeribacter radiodurans]QMU28401.1 carboxypeptidase-like regulatory domain-containing protein [Adhaeribacter radiodurans]